MAVVSPNIGGSGHHHHGHGHSHGSTSPHPAQPIGWSLLRMRLAARLAGAIVVTAMLWIMVLVAMR